MLDVDHSHASAATMGPAFDTSAFFLAGPVGLDFGTKGGPRRRARRTS
jgi:hypothetical protein